MSDAIQCPNSLVAFFPASIYRSAGSSAVLPELLRSVAKEKLSAVQFLPNGVVRLTYKVAADCDAAVSNGIVYGEIPLRVVGVEAKSRLVYLRDCPCEVPDSTVENFLSGFGEVHSVSRSEHEGFPGLCDGSWVARVTLTKDVPSRVRVAGFDCRVWYRRQPASCPVCRKPGHRGNACPLNGLCRRCRQPGHVARECRNAWGSQRVVPSSSAASSARRPASAARPVVVAASPVIRDVEMDSGDEEVVAGAAEAAAAAASSSRPGRRRGTRVTPPVSDASSSGAAPAASEVVVESDMEVVEVLCSGDEEVVAGAAVAAAAAASSSRSARRRRRRRSRQTCSVLFPPSGTVGFHRVADLSPCDMDLSSVDAGDRVSFLSSFKEIWTDTLTWEELRSVKFRHVLRKVGDRVRAVAAVPTLCFGVWSGVGANPVEEEVGAFDLTGIQLPDFWAPSPDRLLCAADIDDHDGISAAYFDFGSISEELFARDFCPEAFRRRCYLDYPHYRPAVVLPTELGTGPALPDVPPAVFSVFVKWSEGEAASGFE